VSEKVEVLPGALYDVRETAAILKCKRVNSVYEIPEDELVPTWVGPRRGKKTFRGSDIIAYMNGNRPVRKLDLAS
jgi:hypothetical protein